MKRKILFVCLGNICRSPLAEAIFSHLVSKEGLNDYFHIESCGTSGNHQGEGADPRTLKNARENGISIQHTSRKLNPEDFRNFDLILTMDRYNFRETVKLATKHGLQHADIRMMRSFDPHAPGADVPDPWYGTEEDFGEVFRILHRSCSSLLDSLRNENPALSGR